MDSNSRLDLQHAMPPELPASAGWRQRTLSALLPRREDCMAPGCARRDSFRTWYRIPGGVEFQDGRCCGPDCLRETAEAAIAALLPVMTARTSRPHRVPLGLLLLSRGVVDAPQLRRAMARLHDGEPGRVGDLLVRDGAATEEEITAGVALQWGRPLFPLAQSAAWRQCRGWLPLALLEALRMAPLYFTPAQQRIYMGFTQTIDFSALAAVTAISGCKTEPCVVADSALDAVLEALRAEAGSAARVADLALPAAGARAMAATIAEQVQRCGVRQVRLAACSNFLWVRLRSPERTAHLTFQR